MTWNLRVLDTCCLHHTCNTIIFQLFAQFSSLAQQIVLIKYRLDSCFGYFLQTPFMVMDMVDSVFFSVLHG